MEKSMREIGGYFETETLLLEQNDYLHSKAFLLNSGRNALEYILRSKKFDKIYIPFFICEVVLQPIRNLHLPYEFYSIDQDLYPRIDKLNKNEVLLYVNYFGILDERIDIIINRYKEVIIDNSQALFCPAPLKVPTYYSPRKFFGLPDGAFLYNVEALKSKFDEDDSKDRISHLEIRKKQGAKAGYEQFKINDSKLDNLPIRLMSKYTKNIIQSLDYDGVIKIRKTNFKLYHDKLKDRNELTHLLDFKDSIIPMVYPLLIKEGRNIKSKLISNGIFVATYWQGVKQWSDESSFEVYLVDNLLALPLDHRITADDINFIIGKIEAIIYGEQK